MKRRPPPVPQFVPYSTRSLRVGHRDRLRVAAVFAAMTMEAMLNLVVERGLDSVEREQRAALGKAKG